jgi:integrase
MIAPLNTMPHRAVAIITAWLGHADTAFTMRTYVHNQPEKLALAVESISSWTSRKKSAQ